VLEFGLIEEKRGINEPIGSVVACHGLGRWNLVDKASHHHSEGLLDDIGHVGCGRKTIPEENGLRQVKFSV
jgi:hypothetical protein